MATLSEHPEYAQSRASFEADLRQAETSGDDVAIEKTRLAWERKTLDMEKQLTAQEQAAARLAATKEQIKKDFPLAPEGSYASITDPEAMIAAAKESHTANVEFRQAANGNTPDASQQTWGGGPATTTPDATGGGPQTVPYESAVAEAVEEAMTGNTDKGKKARKALIDVVWEKKVAPSLTRGGQQ